MNGENISQNVRKTFLQRRTETQDSMVRRGSYLGGGEVVDGVGSNVSGVGRLESGSRSWALHAYPLVLLSCLQKFRNGDCDQGCKEKLI